VQHVAEATYRYEKLPNGLNLVPAAHTSPATWLCPCAASVIVLLCLVSAGRLAAKFMFRFDSKLTTYPQV
jgi:hypothetical protein